MTRLSPRELEEQFELADEEDEALIRHVLLDDEPPQGLHRQGFDRTDSAQKDTDA